MKQAHIQQVETQSDEHRDIGYLADITTQSFNKIAPYWPLKNLIAVNPLRGLEDLPIEEALKIAAAYFEQRDIPEMMEAVNRETIKWMQAYSDEGQATISMPFRGEGLYSSWRKLAVHDEKLHNHVKQKQEILRHLPKSAKEAIAECLLRLGLMKEDHVLFLTLMLTTLPGWASYVKYLTEWSGANNNEPFPICQEDYLAIRLTITSLLWPQAKLLIDWHHNALIQPLSVTNLLEKIYQTENDYHSSLLRTLASQPINPPRTPAAQLVFCIDVRSEPFRKNVEATGDYQTFGFAGFFGIPVQISNSITKETYASCPVLISPKHTIEESACTLAARENDRKGYEYLATLKKLYQSVKYTFTTPFVLVESMGIMSGIWMGMRSFMPRIASKLKTAIVESIRHTHERVPSLDSIPFADQCTYASNALTLIGLTSHFAPLVVFCGHGSSTQNNAYASGLDCGACGGRHGGSNARILAAILNRPAIRAELSLKGITIPHTTRFIAAEHNTTTDEVILYETSDDSALKKLKMDLLNAQKANNVRRLHTMEKSANISNATSHISLRSQDWAQVRPEWGLARNCALIVAPRDITASLDLDGRCFLHSYDYQQDPDGNALTTILTAPMVVAQWINSQYLFSTLNNVAYGGGSKVTKNITGKIGIMQGNASDLMTGLPLQSVYSSDTEAYHVLQRLITVVFAPRNRVDNIIQSQPLLKKLFGNGWITIAVIEPESRKIYLLNRKLLWAEMDYETAN